MQMIRENNPNILLQMLANNEITDWLILEKVIEQQEDQNKQLATKIKPRLDVYLHGDDNSNSNNEQIFGPEELYIDDEYEDNISRILCDNFLLSTVVS